MRPFFRLLFFVVASWSLVYNTQTCLAQQTPPAVAVSQPGLRHTITLRAAGEPGHITGFDLLADDTLVTPVRFTSKGLISCEKALATTNGTTSTLLFDNLTAAPDCGLVLENSRITVTLTQERAPIVAFQVQIKAFDAAKWQAALGKQPFHFLTLAISEATVWQQGGWLCATPRADLFPLLLAPPTAGGLGAAFNREWSRMPALTAHPLPAIGLWAPALNRYVAWDFQRTRLTDGSERDIATGFCNRLIVPPTAAYIQPASELLPPTEPGYAAHKEPMFRQQVSSEVDKTGISKFVALVYPANDDAKTLSYPKGGEHLASQATLTYSLEIGSGDDPNRFLWQSWWDDPATRRLLPRVPVLCAVSEAPDGIAAKMQTAGPPASLESGAALKKFAVKFRKERENCWFWPQPLTGAFPDVQGGEDAATLHAPQGWAVARQLLEQSQQEKNKHSLPLVEGALTWAKYVVWQRGLTPETLAAPSGEDSASVIGFLLAYYHTYQDDTDHRSRALEAVEIARSFAYRSLACWTTNSTDGATDRTFRWQRHAGADALEAPSSATLDALAQIVVQTGDPVLTWALQGSLSRLPTLRAPLLSPQAATSASVIAGEKAAFVTNREGGAVTVQNYRCAGPGAFAFTVRAPQPKVNLTVTFPFADLRQKTVALRRGGILQMVLPPGERVFRNPNSPETVTLTAIRDRDTVVIGSPELAGLETLPSQPPLLSTRQ